MTGKAKGSRETDAARAMQKNNAAFTQEFRTAIELAILSGVPDESIAEEVEKLRLEHRDDADPAGEIMFELFRRVERRMTAMTLVLQDSAHRQRQLEEALTANGIDLPIRAVRKSPMDERRG